MSVTAEVAARIRSLEAEAKGALDDRQDKETHRRNLVAKIRRLLRDISHDAANAKRIGSIFYMYALLYPQGYEDGEPNELEELIALLREAKR